MRSKVLILLLVTLISCSNPIISPPDISIDKLLSAPTELMINNKLLKLETSVYENLMPTIPPSPASISVYCKLFTDNNSTLPANLELNAVYLVYYNFVWKSFLKKDSNQSKKNIIVAYSSNGPGWKPGGFVDVIVKVVFNDNEYFIRAPHQQIGAVY